MDRWCIKETDESTLVRDSRAPLMHHDPSDLESLILTRIPTEHFYFVILFYKSTCKLSGVSHRLCLLSLCNGFFYVITDPVETYYITLISFCKNITKYSPEFPYATHNRNRNLIAKRLGRAFIFILPGPSLVFFF